MVNHEHLRILKQGVDVWNAWREEHPEVRPDLSEANLFKFDLPGANLRGANLRGADLSKADLCEANLIKADIIEADLSQASLARIGAWTDRRDVWETLLGANLSEAKLIGANLSRADLDRAVLSKADLSHANLTGANLCEADLSEARLFEADLSQASLYKVKLTGAYLIRAKLCGANLSGANLLGATLSTSGSEWLWVNEVLTADLSRANLVGATISGVNLCKVNLHEARLWKTNLSKLDLRGAYLSSADLSKADLSNTDLRGAYLTDARLIEADLTNALLCDAHLDYADLSQSNLTKANLTRAKLFRAAFMGADLSEAILLEASLGQASFTGAKLIKANLSGANLIGATLVETDVTGATFTGCKVYGISVWNVRGEPEGQNNLHITREYEPYNEPAITVDNLEVAQFIYMLINYKKLRDVIHTITSKVVLILGRFTEERLVALKALQEELRQYKDKDGKAKYIPVMFDFEPDKANKDLLDTVQTIADMSRFIIADISAAKGVPLELGAIAPRLEVPIKLIFDLSTGEEPVSMVESLLRYDWFMKKVCGYRSTEQLCAAVEGKIIEPVERMVDELKTKKKTRGFEIEEASGG